MLYNNVNLINLTPHTVNIVTSTGEPVVTLPSEGLARCSQLDVPTGTIAGITITSTTYGEVEGLPEPVPNTYYIVSRLVLTACSDRNDLLVPNQVVRDEHGQIVGCQSLANS